MNVCIICSREYEYSKLKGHSKTKCNSCMVNNRRFELKKKCIEYKGGKCLLCGYSRCKKVLSFHHIDPSKKEFEISGTHARQWDRILKELDKCVLLCSNCHMEVHAGFVTLDGVDTSIKFEVDRPKTLFLTGLPMMRNCKVCNKPFKRLRRDHFYCSNDCYLNRAVLTEPSREELAELIKDHTWIKVAEIYGVSSRTVDRWAKKYGLRRRKPKNTPSSV